MENNQKGTLSSDKNRTIQHSKHDFGDLSKISRQRSNSEDRISVNSNISNEMLDKNKYKTSKQEGAKAKCDELTKKVKGTIGSIIFLFL